MTIINNEANTSESTVVAYFTSGENANRAINDLLDEGFKAAEIGAAFHSFTPTSAALSAADAANNDSEFRATTGLGSGISGAASGSSGVTPAGLATGSGTGTSGVGRPEPLPIAIPSSIPRDLPSTLHPAQKANVAYDASPAVVSYPGTGGFHEPARSESNSDSWWEKLKHVFGSDGDEAAPRSESVADKSSLNFGTGEGHLGISPENGYAYSGAAFESAFSSMGLSQPYARQLSSEIGRGGAVVTVNAGSRTTDAEQILERSGGRVRLETFDPSMVAPAEVGTSTTRMQLFGEVRRVYPDHTQRELPTRKAS